MIYSASLDKAVDNGQLTLQAGDLTLQCLFQWSAEVQEQYQLLSRKLTQFASEDPLVTVDGYNRTYSYIDYYLPMYSPGFDFDTFLESGLNIPQSIINDNKQRKIQVLQERAVSAYALNIALERYSELMRWRVTINDGTQQTVAVVQPGGWYQNQDLLYSYRFVSDRVSIGQDDLKFVTFEVRINA